MKRGAILLVVSLLLVSCATMQQGGQALVSRAVQALGGADALAAVKTVSLRGTVRQWEPEQSMTAGGEMRFACESAFETVTDGAAGATRTDWSRKFAYPTPRTFTFTEIVTPTAGYVAGVDSNGRTKQSLESNPPAHSMSGLRLAATQRELRRGSVVLLLEMLKAPDRVSAAEAVAVDGVTYPAVDYRAGDQTFTVMFDPATGLPARIRSRDYDNIWGDVTFDLVPGDWQTTDGVRVATTRRYELNGRLVQETKITSAKINGAVASDLLAIPQTFAAAVSKPATGAVPYQWIIRRQFIGTYLDSDVPSYDTRGSTGLRLVELAPGVQHVVGGSHHTLLVELRDSVVAFDAPVSDWHSNWVLNASRAKFAGKPVKYLVLTHHHMDHAGGLRAYAAQGATLIVGKGTAEHYRRVLAAPFTRNPDLPARDLRATAIVEVAERHVIADGQREVQAYRIDNPHADGLLIGYVPDARLGFTTDIWSPGAAPLPDKLDPALAALVAAVKKVGIEPTRFAGGHGSVADYAPLAALEGR
jgi:glyoxylase-like metal-dependent hydrolase (beta-lactamase superfamily II)